MRKHVEHGARSAERVAGAKRAVVMSGQDFGQKSTLTNQLRQILESYSGAQMLNEMLQV